MAEQAKTKQKADWEAIERDYRAGSQSIRELAKQYGLSDTAIRQRAKEHSWARDLTARVNEKAKADLVRTELRSANPQSEDQIINDAASVVVAVVRGHQKRIGNQVALVDLLTAQLVEAASNRAELEAEIEDQTKDDRTGERRARLLKAVSLPTHTSAAVNLTNALKGLVGMERQAFNIRDDALPPSSNPLSDLMNQLAGKTLRPVADLSDTDE